MELKVINAQGKASGTIKVSDYLFNVEYNESLIHQVVVAQLANRRQGTHSALTRSEVRGGGCKPYRQKGTGRARQGSIVAPNHVGGGIVFAKKPRSFEQKINKRMKDLAFWSAISEKIRQNELQVVSGIDLAEAKTKLVAAMLKAIKVTGKTVIVIDSEEGNEKIKESLYLASRNIENVEVRDINLLSVYDVVANKNLLISKEAIMKLEKANDENV